MTRKSAALACLALSLALHVHLAMQGHIPSSWLLFPVVVGWGAFILPAAVPVVLIERYLLHVAPFADGHTPLTLCAMTGAAALLWLFPNRIARWFGIFDAFKENLWLRVHTRLGLPKWMRHPSVLRGVAYALDAVNKRLFGRQKTGGWA